MRFGDLKVIPGRVQQPITYFTGPWDNFTVHSVKQTPYSTPLKFPNHKVPTPKEGVVASQGVVNL